MFLSDVLSEAEIEFTTVNDVKSAFLTTKIKVFCILSQPCAKERIEESSESSRGIILI